MFRKYMAVILTLCLIAGCFAAAPLSAASNITFDPNSDIMKNEYIAVDAAGEYSMGTSDGEKILYGYPGDGTSFATIWVDDEFERFSDLQELSDNQFNQNTGTVERTGTYKGIEVTQSFRIVSSPATGLDDLVEIKFVSKNTTADSHDVGHRTMLDTMIGRNDRAPFRTGGEAFTTGREFTGADIPSAWQALDQIANPGLVAYARLLGAGVNPAPDKVQFGNWSDMHSYNIWNYVVDPAQENGDSAVSVIWEPKPLAPGESRSYVTYYGLGDASSATGETLALTILAEAKASVSEEGEGYEAYSITALVENTGSTSAENVYVTLNLPEGMSLALGETLTKNLGTIASGASSQFVWNVVFDPQGEERVFTYTVEAGINENRDTGEGREVTVPPLLLTKELFAIAVSTPPNIMNYFIGGEDSSGKDFIDPEMHVVLMSYHSEDSEGEGPMESSQVFTAGEETGADFVLAGETVADPDPASGDETATDAISDDEPATDGVSAGETADLDAGSEPTDPAALPAEDTVGESGILEENTQLEEPDLLRESVPYGSPIAPALDGGSDSGAPAIGSYLDLSGMQVTAYYTDGSSRLLTDGEWTTGPVDGTDLSNLDPDGNNLIPINVSYTEVDKTVTTSFNVALWRLDGDVPGERTLIGVIVTVLPQWLYTQGDAFDSSGMQVVACFFDPSNSETSTSTEVVTGDCGLDPAHGTALSDTGIIEVRASYTSQEGDNVNTQEAGFPIMVKAASTGPTVPGVQTKPVSDVSSSGATFAGEVTADGGAEVTERGFVYGTNAEPTLADGAKVSSDAGLGEFTKTVSDLSANTAYHVRAYATNSAGTAYGADVGFTTASRPGGSTGGGGTSSATLVVQGRIATQGNNYDVVYEKRESVSSRIGQTIEVEAPAVKGYVLNDEAIKTVTIKSGTNTVAFWYALEIADEPTPLAPYPGLEREDHIQYLQGYQDKTVRPDNNISRAEAAAIFFRLIKDTGKNNVQNNKFSDVDSSAWYAQAVNYLANNSILEGYEDGTFWPEQPVTRAEFAAIASRFDNLTESGSNIFYDVTADHWAAKYIGSAYAKGWIKGYADESFKPENFISRAEVVTIINTVLNRKIELVDIPADASQYNDLSSLHWAYCDIIEASSEHKYTRGANGSEIWN